MKSYGKVAITITAKQLASIKPVLAAQGLRSRL